MRPGPPARLPGDGFEHAEAEDKTESSGEKDGPGAGGDATAESRHGRVSWEENAARMKRRSVAAAEFFDEGGRRRG